MNIAKADIYAIRPCYGKDNDGTWNQAKAEKWLSKIWPPGRESVTVQELADCDRVSVADRLWALIHLASARTQRLFACEIAERALLALPETDRDPRSLAAIEVARRHADGRASNRELAAARLAAWAAADAAVATAWSAARSAADAAADAADAWAAWATADAAVRSAAAAQLTLLASMLTE